MQKRNTWKNATLILGIFIIVLLAFNIINQYKVYDFKELGFKMSKKSFEKITNELNVGEMAKVCNSEKCVVIGKIGE